MKIRCSYDKLVPLSSLTPHPQNRNKHPKAQIKRLAQIISASGWRKPIVVSKRSGFITAGHGRLQAAQYMNLPKVPVNFQDYDDEAQEYADLTADNAIALWADLELAGVNEDIASLGPDFEIDLLGIEGFQIDVADRDDKYGGDKETGALVRKFVVPPFSVLDTKQGYWQERKQWWLKKTGNLSLTKEAVLLPEGSRDSDAFNFTTTINEGSSNFDPVLAEVIYKWFGIPGGHLLDPFAGEQTKGVVAGELGYRYTAVDIREDQIEVNRQAVKGYKGIKYICGDSNKLSELVTAPAKGYDLVFTSPPYYDLEVYSKKDLSALGTYGEFMRQYARIFKQCVDLLAPNRFLVVKVGEIRDRQTHEYRNFVGDNIALFREQLGLKYYNEFTLLSPAGTAQLRAARYMRTRKVVKLHQNVLVFFKGDLSLISELYPNLTPGEGEEEAGHGKS